MRRVLLFSNNAPSHPQLDKLNSVDENIKVLYSSHNVTAFIQPIHQGSQKTSREHTENKLFPYDRRCLEPLTQENLQNPWKKILGRVNDNEEMKKAMNEIVENSTNIDLTIATNDIYNCDKIQNSETNDSDEDEESIQIEPGNEEVFSALDKVTCWYERQEDCSLDMGRTCKPEPGIKTRRKVDAEQLKKPIEMTKKAHLP
ncbi:hypothetical protein ABEB36_013982 [Hypothenemus hampei]|uniref:DDE-1 domain-containing protein n=1 Tax=Hypothenemus hampei TaxID=57062 RepID=A0ABD1E2Y1_HYPHA